MKKVLFIAVMFLMTLTASAQFEQGKFYGGASLSGIDFNYSGANKLSLAAELDAGYFVYDNVLVKANVGIDTRSSYTNLSLGVGARYYIIQNGIYLGLNAGLQQVDSERHNDVTAGMEVGYAFFINRHCTIEPAVYYNQSFESHKDYSKFGLKIGFCIYM